MTASQFLCLFVQSFQKALKTSHDFYIEEDEHSFMQISFKLSGDLDGYAIITCNNRLQFDEKTPKQIREHTPLFKKNILTALSDEMKKNDIDFYGKNLIEPIEITDFNYFIYDLRKLKPMITFQSNFVNYSVYLYLSNISFRCECLKKVSNRMNVSRKTR